MKEQKSKLFRELGADLEEALMLGQSFPDRIAQSPIFPMRAILNYCLWRG